ncbi:MAG: IS66 family transposase [Candidatus Saccharimonas sp.]|nr:IS66 family transposase [Planctomycetaceae bacterium]
MEDVHHQVELVLARVAALEAEVARTQVTLAQRAARIVELEAQVVELTVELQRRKKGFRPKANAISRPKRDTDGRTKGERKHPGVVRPPVDPGADDIVHDLRNDVCLECGGTLEDTGEFDEHTVEDIPPPRVEVHRYRRQRQRCTCCRQVSQPPAPSGVADAYVGPRTRLLMGYCRAHLGISLGKSTALLDEVFGLKLSRAGALGHIRWAGDLVNPVVQRLFELLKSEPVIHADETGWRINGRNVWVWCFCNPRLALFLVDETRSGAVVQRVLGDSLPGVLVTDFYVAYHALDCRKQKCLAHLLRELHTLRDDATTAAKDNYLQPLMTLLQDAISLGKTRSTTTGADFATARQSLERRLDVLIFTRPKDNECQRINKRLVKHRSELFCFLEVEGVPPDNNAGERDIRSVAAARADGGVNRTQAGATAFANLKSIIRTCQKHSRNFLNYGLSLIGLDEQSRPLPFPALTAIPESLLANTS